MAGDIEGELAEELAGGGVDDGDVQAVDQRFYGGAVVVAADSDGVEAAAVAQGDFAGVDFVGADAGVRSCCGFGLGVRLG